MGDAFAHVERFIGLVGCILQLFMLFAKLQVLRLCHLQRGGNTVKLHLLVYIPGTATNGAEQQHYQDEIKKCCCPTSLFLFRPGVCRLCGCRFLNHGFRLGLFDTRFFLCRRFRGFLRGRECLPFYRLCRHAGLRPGCGFRLRVGHNG